MNIFEIHPAQLKQNANNKQQKEAEDYAPSACQPGSQVGHRTHSKGLSACTVSILECAINSRLSHVKVLRIKIITFHNCLLLQLLMELVKKGQRVS